MKFGLIGAGRIGRIHGAHVASRPDARLAFVADQDPSAANGLAATTGATVVSAEAMIADPDVDAILICTRIDQHARLIEEAANAGKAIFCEKPLDLDVERARASLSAVKRAGVPLMIGFNRRFDPNFSALKARIDRGAIGQVESVSIVSRDPAPPTVALSLRSGGLFRDMTIHDLDMVRFILGEEPVAIFASGASLVDPAFGAAGDVDTAIVVVETASGKMAHISNSRRASYGHDQRIEVHGSKGMIRAGNVSETTLEIAGAKGFTTDPVQNFFLERYAAAFRLELDAFILSAKRARAPSPSGEDGLRAQVLADAAALSQKERRRVEVGC